MFNNWFSALTVFLLFIAILILGPIFTIIAINTLFGTQIDLTFWTWLATFWITLIFAPKPTKSN